MIFVILDRFTDSLHHLADIRTITELPWFVGICVPPQVVSEVTMGEMITEVPDSYKDEGDKWTNFGLNDNIK